jgi:tRNA(fMet)-specific endonuclease VapC
MLDTNVAIHLRDGDPQTLRQVSNLDDSLLLSIITRIELENGVRRDPSQSVVRRERLDALFEAIPAVAFEDADADAYRTILETTGFSRRKVLDRMIAAQALVRRVPLVTMNADDFRDVPGLNLLPW